MPRRKLADRNTRKIMKSGGSLVVSIPKEILKELRWRVKQKVVVKKKGNGVFIGDWE